MTWLLSRPPIVWHGAAIYSLKTFIFLFTASIMPHVRGREAAG